MKEEVAFDSLSSFARFRNSRTFLKNFEKIAKFRKDRKSFSKMIETDFQPFKKCFRVPKGLKTCQESDSTYSFIFVYKINFNLSNNYF